MAPIYETDPLEGAGPGTFLNTVAQGWTALDPRGLLEAVGAIEADLGRMRQAADRRGPRTIDIDVLLFADLVQGDERLTLPHPRMAGRRFVLLPLLDLAPALADPRTGRPYRLLLQALPPQGVRPWGTDLGLSIIERLAGDGQAGGR